MASITPSNNLKMVTITAPNGAAGCWIIDTMSTNIEAGINSLKNIINVDNVQNFSINCCKLEDARIPDSDNLGILDPELQYISPDYLVIAPIDDHKCIRNVDLMSRIVRQCILSDRYYAFVIKYLNDRCDVLGNGDMNMRNHESDKYKLWSAYKKTIEAINTAVSAITGNPV